MSNNKNEATKVAQTPKTAQTSQVAEQPKVATDRNAQAKSIGEILESQLKEIQRKKKLADNRSIFLRKKSELSDCITALNDDLISGNFDNDKFALKFGRKGDYRDEHMIFTIANPEILTKFLATLQTEIDASITKIEKELLQDIA